MTPVAAFIESAEWFTAGVGIGAYICMALDMWGAKVAPHTHVRGLR